MKRYLQILLAGSFAFCIVPALGRPDDADKPDKSTEKAKDSEVKIPELRTGAKEDFDAVCADAGVSGEQLDKIHELAEKRVEKLKAWADSENGKKLNDLRKELSSANKQRTAQRKATNSTTQPVDYDAKLAKLKEEIRPLMKEFADLRNSTRGDVLEQLTPEQQQKAVVATLSKRLEKVLEDAKLTDDQKAKVKKMAEEASEAYLKKTPLDQDPNMSKLVGVQSSTAKHIRDEVLTNEQREKLKATDKKEPEAPTTQKD